MRSPVTGRRRAALFGVIGAVALLVGPIASAGADPVNAGTASAFGATITVAGETVIPPTPEETSTLPPGGENSNTIVDIPADPLALSGTLTANATVNEASDLDSALVTGTTQDVAGPYNAHAQGVVEDAEVLVDLVGEDVSLLTADVIRAEAVGVCRDGAVEYSATSEVIGLSVAGEQLPLNAPVQDLVDAIGDLLTDTGLNAVVDVQRNVVTASADGDLPECSDGIDNDGDGDIDFPADSDCTSASDDSEAGLTGPASSPQQASNVGLPRTGDESTVALAVGLTLAGLAFAARRFWSAA